jgi:aryl-alcohol dehydrogenase-like predicted oxidoreductase/enamine deaminase RidA (YjgF/YER057c/UK114 family)
VERVELAPGLEISRLITGLWQVADMERDGVLDPEAAAREMAPYVEAGLTTFDMADHYGSAEEIAGHFREGRGGAGAAAGEGEPGVQLLTKWVPSPGPVTRADVREAVERALGRLRTEALDLLQFHAWRYSDPRWLDCLFWLEELRQEGLIRHLGLTNFDGPHLAMVLHSGIPVVSNQVAYSLLDRRPENGLTALCRAHGIHLLCYGTVAGGLLTERWLGRPDPGVEAMDTWSQMKYRRFVGAAGGWDRFQGLLAVVSRVAQRLGVSMANVASRYVLDQPGVGGVIIGARLGESRHIEDNLRLFDFELDSESLSELREAMDSLDPIPGDSGDEYRMPPFLTASGDLRHHFRDFPSPYEVRSGAGGREQVLSGTMWEDVAGFSRAVRRGSRILVSGTTATHGDRCIGGSDPGAQAHFCIDKIEGALQSLGASLQDVVRTRIYVRHAEDWEPVARAHGSRFGDVQPANTLVQAGLIGDEYLVEMEAEAVIEPALPLPAGREG